MCRQYRGVMISTDLKAKELTERARVGLNRDQIVDNLVLYGESALVLPVPSVASLLFNEIFHPFYVFQMYSVVLWIFEEYWYFAGAIAVIAVVSIVQTLMETRRRMRELAELARFDCPVQVLRDSTVRTISSSQLVPGDVVLVGTGLLPCDLALIDGGAVVNESMLTGQSPRSGQPRAPCAPWCSCHPKAFAHLTHIVHCVALRLVWLSFVQFPTRR